MSLTPENPYAVAQEQAVVDTPTELLYDVEPTGTFLVVPHEVELPPRCVFTNLPANESGFVVKQFSWVTGTFPFSLQRCQLRYFTTARIRKIQTRVWLLERFSNILAFVAVGMTFSQSTNTVLLFAVSAIATLCVSALIKRTCPDRLRVEAYRDDRFWISGCSREFLLELREELGL